MTNKNKNRIEWIDYIKGSAMFLIILSHVGAPELYVRIYTPVFLFSFFFMSGYTWNPREGYISFLFHKVKVLVLPLLFLGTVNTVLAAILTGDPFWERIIGLCLQRCGYWDDLWFVGCLFSTVNIFYFIVWVSKRLCKNNPQIAVLILSIVVWLVGVAYIENNGVALPWQFENALVMTLYVALGNEYKYYESKNFLKNFESNVFTLPLMLIAYLCTVFAFRNIANIHLKQYGNWSVILVSSLIGMYAYILMSKKSVALKTIKCFRPIFYFIVWVGSNTLVYYAFQSKIIFVLQKISERMGFDIHTYIGALVATCVVYVMLCIPAEIMNRLCPRCIGKNNLSNEKF